MVQISSAHGPTPATDSGRTARLPHNKYTGIESQDPTAKKHRDWPEYQTCKSTTAAIVTENAEPVDFAKPVPIPNVPYSARRSSGPTASASGHGGQQLTRLRDDRTTHRLSF